MKLNNKFIAIGLGLGLSFTGTYSSYSWFSDSDHQSHKISIGQLIEEWNNDITVRYGCLCGDKDKDEITIDFGETLKGRVTYISLKNKKGKFENAYIEETDYQNKKISIDRTYGNFTDLGIEFSDSQSMEVVVNRTVGNKSYQDVFKFQFKTTGTGKNVLEYRYKLISSTEKNSINLEEENDLDQAEPPVTDDACGDENNGAVTLPELGEDGNNGPATLPELDKDENNGEVTLPELGEDENNGEVTLPELGEGESNGAVTTPELDVDKDGKL